MEHANNVYILTRLNDIRNDNRFISLRPLAKFETLYTIYVYKVNDLINNLIRVVFIDAYRPILASSRAYVSLPCTQCAEVAWMHVLNTLRE